MRKKFYNSGFTLVELLVVATIIGILMTTGLASYNSFNRKRIVRETALELLNNLRYAQGKALSGEMPSSGCTVLDGYQVTFSPQRYEVQAKCSAGLAGEIKQFNLPENVDFVALPGNIVFKVLAQGVTGETDIFLRGLGYTYKIKVSSSGEISDEGFQP